MGRHVWFRTPTLEDRKDIFNLYLCKVDHEPDLDTDRRREELARITNGYAPAMIEQVCSLALTYSHADGRQRFGWSDIVEAMTTVESGTAVSIEYMPEETRAVAVHEAGHAVNSHLFMRDVLSTRLSIRKRGNSLGHHQAIQTNERFSSWRSEEFAEACVDARGDGCRARLLRRELDRRRRRRAERDTPRRVDGGNLWDGARAGADQRLGGARRAGRGRARPTSSGSAIRS